MEATEETRVPDHVFRYVERELYSYRTYKVAVAELEKDLADLLGRMGGLSTEPRSAHWTPGDPSSLHAVKACMIEGRINLLQTRIRKIDAGLSLLSQEEEVIVRAKYLCGLERTNEEIINQLRLPRNKFYRLRHDIIARFAIVFGVQ